MRSLRSQWRARGQAAPAGENAGPEVAAAAAAPPVAPAGIGRRVGIGQQQSGSALSPRPRLAPCLLVGAGACVRHHFYYALCHRVDEFARGSSGVEASGSRSGAGLVGRPAATAWRAVPALGSAGLLACITSLHQSASGNRQNKASICTIVSQSAGHGRIHLRRAAAHRSHAPHGGAVSRGRPAR